MMKVDLHPHWYRRLLVFWLFTGPPMLVLANFHNPNWFSVFPGLPPLSEGVYPTVSWAVIVFIIWQPALLFPFWLWSKQRRRASKVENA